MLISKDYSCLVLFNIQKEFIPSFKNGQNLIDHCCWLLDVAGHFNIPVIIINHKKLGEPLGSLKKLAKNNAFHSEITTFSCLKDEDTNKYLKNLNKKQVLLAGAESHISILQSAYELKESGYHPFVIIDAITARNEVDHHTAINRLNQYNIAVVSREMVFFEFLQNSAYPNYIDMSLKFLDGRYIRA